MSSPTLVWSTALLLLVSACGAGADESPDAQVADAASDAATSCEGPDFRFAPPPSSAFGIERVFVDIERLEASVVFDVAAEVARARATMYFRMGDEGGNPTFDLRQNLAYIEVNGTELHPASVRFSDFSLGLESAMRVAEIVLEPCSDNTLYVEYELATPIRVSEGTPPAYSNGALTWGFKLYDVWPGRLLEQWFPANLPHDRFEFTVDIHIDNTAASHTLISNGAVEEFKDRRWRVTFPDYFTSFSPMLEIVPTDKLDISTTTVTGPDSVAIALETYKHHATSTDIAAVNTTLSEAIVEFVASDGPYLHGDTFIAYVLPSSYQAEEYEGATTSHSNPTTLRHELYHSWYGRGVRPARFNDGWFDEAWVMYIIDEAPVPLASDDPPLELHSSNPWFRGTPGEAYDEGARLFATLAGLIGAAELRAIMRDFVQDNALAQITSADLERHLYCESQVAEVRFWFHRFVYGRDGEPEAVAADYCER